MSIQRLTSQMRQLVKMNGNDARMMHVVKDTQINSPLPLTSYKIKTGTDRYDKYILADENIIIATYKKIGKCYKRVALRILDNISDKNIKQY